MLNPPHQLSGVFRRGHPPVESASRSSITENPIPRADVRNRQRAFLARNGWAWASAPRWGCLPDGLLPILLRPIIGH